MQIVRKEGKTIMLIHNFRNIKTHDDIQEAIKRDILEVFEDA